MIFECFIHIYETIFSKICQLLQKHFYKDLFDCSVMFAGEIVLACSPVNLQIRSKSRFARNPRPLAFRTSALRTAILWPQAAIKLDLPVAYGFRDRN